MHGSSLGQIYVPATRPGHRLPHAWVEKNNTIISTHDLVGRAALFLLITDSYGSDWVIAAHSCAFMWKNAIVIAQIGSRGNKGTHVIDHDEQWERVKGLKDGGALLVVGEAG